MPRSSLTCVRDDNRRESWDLAGLGVSRYSRTIPLNPITNNVDNTHPATM